MKLKTLTSLCAATMLLGSIWVQAQEAEDTDGGRVDQNLDLTMTLLPEGATKPDAITRVITLPDVAFDQAGDNASQGLETADDARARREAGLQTAADAIEGGREFGQSMREQAQENRENRGRGDPPAPPDSPGAPNPPGRPPGNPPGPPGN